MRLYIASLESRLCRNANRRFSELDAGRTVRGPSVKVVLDTNILACAEGTNGIEMRDKAVDLIQCLPALFTLCSTCCSIDAKPLESAANSEARVPTVVVRHIGFRVGSWLASRPTSHHARDSVPAAVRSSTEAENLTNTWRCTVIGHVEGPATHGDAGRKVEPSATASPPAA
jgi:hypothetical protein